MHHQQIFRLHKTGRTGWYIRRSCTQIRFSWISKNGNCRVLPLCNDNHWHQYMLENNWLESKFEEKDLWVLVENKLKMGQQCSVMKCKITLGCTGMGIASRLRKVIGPASQHWWGHIWSILCRSGLPHIRKTWTYYSKTGKGPCSLFRIWNNWHMWSVSWCISYIMNVQNDKRGTFT